jgi:hypothetical protein
MQLKALTSITLLTSFVCGFAQAQTIPLAGQWQFAMDRQNLGLTEKWFEKPLAGGGTITLPGTMDDAKLGIPNPAEPSLGDLWRPVVYEGVAWYQRQVAIPADWRGKRVTLFLERCRWVTQTWLDGQPVGEPRDSLIAPHVHELGTDIKPGKHTLTLRVDNTKKIDLGGFVSALYGGTQGNLNGIVGKIDLRATPPVWIEVVQVYPQVEKKTVRVRGAIGNVTGQPGGGTASVRVSHHGDSRPVPARSLPVSWTQTGGSLETEVPIADAGGPETLWDEFSPSLYELEARLGESEPQSVTFGFRDLSRRGTQFTMNGRPLFLRGTLECQVFPLTGYPPMEVPAWRRILQIEKSYGLNFIRFHSWCPPEAAFAAADLEGVMIQAEAPQANVDAGSNPERDAFTEAELLRMIRTYGNHPSFCLMTLGNEYGGNDELLSRWVDMLVKEDPRHLYSSASSAQRTSNRQWTEDSFDRGIHGPCTTDDVHAAITHEIVPPIGHEIGQWVYFPDFDEMKKYTGVMLPRNFEIIRDDLRAKGMLDLAPQFSRATGHQATLLYKEEIELLLRTPGFAGFSLLDLHDYPSQGTATVGLLDPFWDSKGFIEPAQHRRYCGAVVPLLRMPKRTYVTAEPFSATAEIANYGTDDITGAKPFWRISDERGTEIASGDLEPLTAPTGKLSPLGPISASLAKAAAPCKLTVTVGLKEKEVSNWWDIWVYPDEPLPPPPANIVVRASWDKVATTALSECKTVLLLLTSEFPRRSLRGSFLPTFWSPVWFPTQSPDTMSILCDPKHALFAQFPTDYYSDWQWYDLMQNSRSMILDGTPADFRPLVQVIDNFARNHKLGTVFEARVGKGKLVVCSIDLASDLGNRPAARQFAKSLYAYLASENFKPAHDLGVDALDSLLVPASIKTIRADSEAPGNEAINAIDGEVGTIWHTPWEGGSPPDFPHQLVIELCAALEINGFTALPRQDGNQNGWIKDYALFVSADGVQWGEPVAKGVFPNDSQLKTVNFPAPITARFVKLIALSGYANGPWASLAEFSVIQSPH